MSDYTPTTEEVRESYAEDDVGVPRARFFPEFDRWLDSVKAEAWDEGFGKGEISGQRELPLNPRTENPYREQETP